MPFDSFSENSNPMKVPVRLEFFGGPRDGQKVSAFPPAGWADMELRFPCGYCRNQSVYRASCEDYNEETGFYSLRFDASHGSGCTCEQNRDLGPLLL